MVDIGSTHNSYTGETESYLVPAERLRDVPGWDGPVGEPPLSIGEAVAAARKQAERDHPKVIGKLRSLIFGPRTVAGREIWTYSIGFPVLDNPNVPSVHYVVLLDGSVVAPSKR